MASNIDPTKPSGPIAYTADVRDNFAAAKSEIEALQTGVGTGGPFLPIAGGQMGGALITSATARPAMRSVQDRFGDVVHVKDFGAVFDGASHPLSAYYPTLAAAQAVYPHAVALSDEIDGVAIQAAINYCATRIVNYSGGGEVRLPSALGLINRPLTITKTNVSLRGGSFGFMVRANVGVPFPSAPTTLKWTGAARTPGQGPINMLTVAPLVADLRMLVGCNVTGIMWDCNFVPGVSGPLFMSMRDAIIDVACREPNGIAYSGAVLTAGSRNITVFSTVGVNLGESVVSASLPEGSQVSLIVNATTLQLTTQASASSTETVTIGGTGIRFDVVDNLADSNSIQLFHARFWGQALSGGVNATAPLVLIGGTDVQKLQPGNTCIAWFDLIYTVTANGVAVAINNSDHLMFENVSNVWLGSGATPALIVCNGAIDPRNGGGRFHHFRHIGGAGAIKFTGTDTAGFTRGSLGNVISFLDLQNGAAYPTVGVGSSVLVTGDNSSPALAGIGSTIGVSAHVPDSTALAGNVRGAYAVDLQTTRTTATQVASGQSSVVGGGIANTASGTQSAVLGGFGNLASAVGAAVLGGVANSATGTYSTAHGIGAAAELYAADSFAGGTISQGRRAQETRQLLRATSTAGTTPVRLLADGSATPTTNNCANLTYSGQANALSVRLVAINNDNPANAYVWSQPLGLFTRNGLAVVYTPIGTPTTGGAGAISGIAVVEAADVPNFGYSLTFTPPPGNLSVWAIVAVVTWARIDASS